MRPMALDSLDPKWYAPVSVEDKATVAERGLGMPVPFPHTAGEARHILTNLPVLKIVWCARCTNLVIPFDRPQRMCPICKIEVPEENNNPMATYSRTLVR